MAEDDNVSGSSFSEASSIEGDSEDFSEVENIKKHLQPAIQKRVNAWPKKGINFQLKTVHPSVTVDDWLKANQEFTTTTKDYKKTVVTEVNKTVTTTTKRTKTTTKKSSFNSFVPRLIGIEEVKNHQLNEIEPAISAISNDSVVPHTNSKGKKNVPTKKKKVEDQRQPAHHPKEKGLPVKINLSRLADFPVTNRSSEENVETFTRPKRSTRKTSKLKEHKELEKPKQIKSKSDEKNSKSDAMSSDQANTRCLRSRFKENIVEQVQDEKSSNKQPKMKMTKIRKEPDNQMELYSENLPSTSVTPFVKKSESVHRSRSPLKEREVNRKENCHKLSNAKVVVKKMPPVVVPTRKNSRIQKSGFEQTSDSGARDTNSQFVSNYNSSCNLGAQTIYMNRSQRPSIMMKNVTRRQIVMHSPNSETFLGTKIDNTFMLVTKNDYKKHIAPKYIRKTDLSVMNNSIVPINRRIVYQPPAIDTTNDNTDYDSECEDVLLTSHINTGHIIQLKL